MTTEETFHFTGVLNRGGQLVSDLEGAYYNLCLCPVSSELML